MGLSSIFKRKTAAPGASPPPEGATSGGRRRRRGSRSANAAAEPAAASTFGQDPVDEVQRARSRARHRLIGAVVLLGIGVVGFPLVFETQPRPIPVDIPIEIPRRDSAPPLTTTAPEPAPDPERLQDASTPAKRAVPTPPDDVVTESRDDAGSGAKGRPTDAVAARAPAPRPAASATALASRSTPDVAKSNATDGARAQALLEGKAVPGPAASAPTRFVVQIGAFADPNAAQDTRLKVEKLGLKTYTQVASTAAGGRTRVRVGPFASRDEADRALAKARGAGLSAVVVTL